jgi:hypothetical protein
LLQALMGFHALGPGKISEGWKGKPPQPLKYHKTRRKWGKYRPISSKTREIDGAPTLGGSTNVRTSAGLRSLKTMLRRLVTRLQKRVERSSNGRFENAFVYIRGLEKE